MELKVFVREVGTGLTIKSSAILRVDLTSTLPPAVPFELALRENYSQNIQLKRNFIGTSSQ
jgi:hypothetical protein